MTHTARTTMALTLALLGGCEPDTDAEGNISDDDRLPMEVSIEAPPVTVAGVPFTATVTTTGTVFDYEWTDFQAVISDPLAAEPRVTACRLGEQTLELTARGAVMPGVPGIGSAEHTYQVVPPPDVRFEDSTLSDGGSWLVVASADCDGALPDNVQPTSEAVAAPQAHRRLTYSHTKDGSYDFTYANVSMVWAGSPYVPGDSGAPETIRIRYRRGHPDGNFAGFGGTPMLLQDGVVYLLEGNPARIATETSGENTWQTYDSFAVPADDTAWSGLCNADQAPDFSAGAPQLAFGMHFTRGMNAINDGETETYVVLLDDFEVEVATSPWSPADCRTAADLCPDDPAKGAPGACGCGNPDTDNDGDGVAECDDPNDGCEDVGGDWTLSFSNTTSSCGPEEDAVEVIHVVQTGCDLVVTGIHGTAVEVAGTIDGTHVVIGEGDIPEGSGVTHLTFDMTLETDTRMTGRESWTWDPGPESGTRSRCTGGVSDLVMTR